MFERAKEKKIATITLAILFALGMIADLLTTFRVYRYPIFNETNIIFLLSNSFWYMAFAMIVIYSYVIWLLLFKYAQIGSKVVRYVIIASVCFIFISSAFDSVSNYQIGSKVEYLVSEISKRPEPQQQVLYQQATIPIETRKQMVMTSKAKDIFFILFMMGVFIIYNRIELERFKWSRIQ